jgi:hypothetical protein
MAQSIFWTRCLVLLIGNVLVIMARAQGGNSTDYYCNICGDNNSIQFPTGVVEFEYQNETYRNNCQTWQDIVMNPNAISDDFCRNVLFNYTVEICRCTTPSGEFVADVIQQQQQQQQQQNTAAPTSTPGSAQIPDDMTPSPATTTTAPGMPVDNAQPQELEATPFTVKYDGITSNPSIQDLGQVQDVTCTHVRDTVTELLGRLANSNCNATFDERDTAVYDFQALLATTSNTTTNYTKEDLDEAIDQAFFDRFRENKLLSKLKNLPEDNPFSSTTAVTSTTNPRQSPTESPVDDTPNEAASGSDSFGMVSGRLLGGNFLLLIGMWQIPC